MRLTLPRLSVLRWLVMCVAIVATQWLAGCDVKNKPLELQGSPLVGVWETEINEVSESGLRSQIFAYIEFTEAGYVAFQRLDCWTERVKQQEIWHEKAFGIDFMPVIKITQEKLKAQWMRFTPTLEFKINQWPSEQEGHKVLVIDNIALLKKAQAADRSGWRCPQQ